MKSDKFEIEYKGRKATVTTQFENLVELFRIDGRMMDPGIFFIWENRILYPIGRVIQS